MGHRCRSLTQRYVWSWRISAEYLRAREAEWELGTLAIGKRWEAAQIRGMGKSAIGTGLAGLAVLVASPGPPPAIVRNGFRRPDGRRGSGQFAKSALDTLYVARNRGPGWPVPRGNNLFYGCH